MNTTNEILNTVSQTVQSQEASTVQNVASSVLDNYAANDVVSSVRLNMVAYVQD